MPLTRLTDAFHAAALQHKSGFPVSAYEVAAAYRQIVELEEIGRIAAQQEHQEANAIDLCKHKAMHIDGDGNTEMANPLNHAEKIIVPCFYCRQKACVLARERFIQRHGNFDSMEIVSNGQMSGAELAAKITMPE